MNHTTQHAHPFFAIELSNNFEFEADELRAFVMAMPNWKYIEIEGTEIDGTEVDTMFIWAYSSKETPRPDYNIQSFVEFMNMSGFDIPADDVIVAYNYPAFTCECCNFAPVVPVDELSRVEGIYGNIDNKQLYVQKVMRRQTCA